MPGLRNTVWDGVFHTFTWLAVLTGLGLLYARVTSARGRMWRSRVLWGWMLVGGGCSTWSRASSIITSSASTTSVPVPTKPRGASDSLYWAQSSSPPDGFSGARAMRRCPAVHRGDGDTRARARSTRRGRGIVAAIARRHGRRRQLRRARRTPTPKGGEVERLAYGELPRRMRCRRHGRAAEPLALPRRGPSRAHDPAPAHRHGRTDRASLSGRGVTVSVEWTVVVCLWRVGGVSLAP